MSIKRQSFFIKPSEDDVRLSPIATMKSLAALHTVRDAGNTKTDQLINSINYAHSTNASFRTRKPSYVKSIKRSSVEKDIT